MKRPVLPKVLALSVATMLVVGTVSVNAYTNDTASTAAIPSVSGYSISNSNLDAQAKSDVKAKAQSVIKDTKNVDAKKSTSIVFDGSPVKKVEYDGEAHGLSAGAYPTLGGKRIADADMYYVGVQEDGTYYSSSKAPTEPGYYYVAATYPGSDDWYPIMAYGVVVITKKAPTPTEKPTTTPTEQPTSTPVNPTATPSTTATPTPTKKATATPTKTTKKTTKTTKKTTAKKTTTNKKKAAKTGDATNFVFYIAGIVAAGAAITLTLRKRKH